MIRLVRSRETLLLFLILVLGACLRFSALRWGLATPEMPHTPFHPDETWVAGCLSQINISTFHFNPDNAHREGTLCYYIWTLVALVLRGLGFIHTLPYQFNPTGQDMALFLKVARAVNQCLDLGSVALVFLILKRITSSRVAPLIGALVLAVFPFEIIHGIYLRTHVPGNFFMLLVVYFSLEIYSRKVLTKRYIGFLGILCGLATAARYTSAVVLVVPWSILVYRRWSESGRSQALWRFLLPPELKRLSGFWIIGLFLGDPFLFIRFDHARKHLMAQASYTDTGQFGSLSSFLEVSKLFEYFTYLIPYGALPALWVVLYSSSAYLIFKRKYHQYTLPLFLLLVVYLYPMAKGYLRGVANIRAAIFTFPIFAIFSGLAIGEWFRVLHGRLFSQFALGTAIGVILLGSVFYDAAYLKAMILPDPREQVYSYIKVKALEKPLVIATKHQNPDYLQLNRVLEGKIPIGRITYVEPKDLAQAKSVDYVLLSAEEVDSISDMEKKSDELVRTGKFKLEKRFESELSFLGVKFNYKRNPVDLQFPLPVFFLLRPVSEHASFD